jgi:[ribosomal protein S18]-alanine N-acetyltransferase
MRRSLGITEDEPVEVEITRMRRRHLKGVMAIERQVYPRPWSPNLFLSEMTELRNRCYLVAKVGRNVVGYGGIMAYGDEGHVTTIAVDPVWHRRKIGTRLMHELVQEAIRLGARAVSLEVRVSNYGAQRLYSRFGYRPVGIRRGYYQETGEDALVMWADGIRAPEYRERLARLLAEADETEGIDGSRSDEHRGPRFEPSG